MSKIRSSIFVCALAVLVTCVFAGTALAEDITVNATQSMADDAGVKVVTTSIDYAGGITALGFRAFVPEGWALVSVTGDKGTLGPDVTRTVKEGQATVLEFAWTRVPVSPINFTYKVSAPTKGEIAAEVLYRGTGDEMVVPVN